MAGTGSSSSYSPFSFSNSTTASASGGFSPAYSSSSSSYSPFSFPNSSSVSASGGFSPAYSSSSSSYSPFSFSNSTTASASGGFSPAYSSSSSSYSPFSFPNSSSVSASGGFSPAYSSSSSYSPFSFSNSTTASASGGFTIPPAYSSMPSSSGFEYGAATSSSHSLLGTSTLIGSSSSAAALSGFGATSGGVPTSSLFGGFSPAPSSASQKHFFGMTAAPSTTVVSTISASQSSSTTMVAASSSGATKMSETGEFNFTLEALIDKEKSKVMFAEAGGHFTDILLSFLTLPLGRIVKVLEKHYGDETLVIGSLTTLYHSVANLDTLHFCTEGAKLTLLNPKSSFELEYERLKLDIYDSQPAEYFHCTRHQSGRFRSVSVYYDHCHACRYDSYNCHMEKEAAKEGSRAVSSGVFTIPRGSFIISDDLQILPNDTGVLRVMGILGITDIEKAAPVRVTIGLNEIMSLLKASLTSPTPLSDLILNKTIQMNSVMVETETGIFLDQIANEEDPSSKKMSLKVMIQKSICKVLYAQAQEDFVEFLFSFLYIPLGGVEHLVGGKTRNKALNNLYRSTSEFIHDEKFMTPDTKNVLIKPNLPHGCVSKNHILPLTEESLPAEYSDLSRFSSVKFPKGQGRYLECPQTYKVMDDLSVTPFCIMSTISSLNELRIPLSDIKEMQLQIGLKEGLRILRASLTSTSALTDGLLNHIQMPLTQPKQEPNWF